jgi:hypothetical protein
MPDKRKSGFKHLFKLVLLVPRIVDLACNILSLFKLESRLAVKSVMILIIGVIFFALIMGSAWFCLLALLFVYLTTILFWTSIAALLTISGINISILFVVGWVMFKVHKNLFFPRTSQVCRSLCNIGKQEF